MAIQIEVPMGEGFTDSLPVSPGAELGQEFERLLRRYIYENEKTKTSKNMVNFDGFVTTDAVINTNQEGREEIETTGDKNLHTKISHGITSTSDLIGGDKENTHPLRVSVPEKTVETMYKCKRKKLAKLKKKQQGEKKPWIPVDPQSLSFEFSLLPKRVAVLDEEMAMDMDQELEKFHKECQDEVNTAGTPTTNESLNSPVKKNAENAEMDRIGREYVINYRPRTWKDLDYDRFWNHFSLEPCLEDYLTLKELRYYENIELTGTKDERLRQKKKWRVEKAHRQVKTRHCSSVHNKPHGQKLYIHHRVYKQMEMIVDSCRGNWIQSMKRIDREKGYPRKNEDDLKHTPETPASQVRTRTPRQQSYPVAQPVPPAAISAYNFDGDLSADLVNALVHLQDRDLTPEDYELLLQLDERVKPKTVSEEQLSGLKTDTVTEANVGDLCAVCMEAYELGQVRKFLPCEHVFHKECIDMWLSNSSPTCPLDGMDVS